MSKPKKVRPQQTRAPFSESNEERVQRLYKSEGGPLLGWLEDEAHNRGQTLQQMSKELGVTYGYIAQLRSGLRSQKSISKGFATSCARYLGVPTVVILLLSGFLTLRDFATYEVDEEAQLNRALRKMQQDPHLLIVLGAVDLLSLTLESKRMLVTIYGEFLGHDYLGGPSLPKVVGFLQRAAVIHSERELALLQEEVAGELI